MIKEILFLAESKATLKQTFYKKRFYPWEYDGGDDKDRFE
jgi:hypothetical protein